MIPAAPVRLLRPVFALCGSLCFDAGIGCFHFVADYGGRAHSCDGEQFLRNGVGGADAAVGKASSRAHFTGVDADAVARQLQEIRHGRAFVGAALRDGRCRGRISIDTAPLRIVQVAVAGGDVIRIFGENPEFARRCFVPVCSGGNRPIHGYLVVYIETPPLLRKANVDNRLGSRFFQKFVIREAAHRGGVACGRFGDERFIGSERFWRWLDLFSPAEVAGREESR